MNSETEAWLSLIAPQSPTAAQVYAVRGNLIVASLESLRHFDLYERYEQHLAPSWRDQVMFCLASSWVPVEVAVAHSEALEALQLSLAEHAALGDFVSARVAGAFFGSLLRSSRTHGFGTSPWTPLREYHRIFERMLQGCAVTMLPRAQKEAVLVIRGVPMLRFGAFRQTILALTRHAVGGFVCRTFVRDLGAACDSETMRVQVRWL